MSNPDVQELATRARKLACVDAAHDCGVYEHPKFFVSINDDRIYVGLNNKAGQSQPVSVYWESRQLTGSKPTDYQVNMEWVPETLEIMRQVMVLDDLAEI